MRQKRAKAYKRVMALYVSAFGFRQPYQVLLSDEFLLEAAKQKDVDWWKMLGTTVQGEVKPSEWRDSESRKNGAGTEGPVVGVLSPSLESQA